MRGEVETTEDGVLVIRRIRVRYYLKAGESAREAAERVLAVHQKKCPVYRSLEKSIDFTTELELTGDA